MWCVTTTPPNFSAPLLRGQEFTGSKGTTTTHHYKRFSIADQNLNFIFNLKLKKNNKNNKLKC